MYNPYWRMPVGKKRQKEGRKGKEEKGKERKKKEERVRVHCHTAEWHQTRSLASIFINCAAQCPSMLSEIQSM